MAMEARSFFCKKKRKKKTPKPKKEKKEEKKWDFVLLCTLYFVVSLCFSNAGREPSSLRRASSSTLSLTSP
jgi:hypothetical protein